MSTFTAAARKPAACTFTDKTTASSRDLLVIGSSPIVCCPHVSESRVFDSRGGLRVAFVWPECCPTGGKGDAKGRRRHSSGLRLDESRLVHIAWRVEADERQADEGRKDLDGEAAARIGEAFREERIWAHAGSPVRGVVPRVRQE